MPAGIPHRCQETMMRFARLAAAMVFVVVLATPARIVLRAAVGVGDVMRAPSVGLSAVAWFEYFAVLVVSYGLVLGACSLARSALVYLSSWESSGLAVLDHPIAREWPIRWAALLGAGNVVASVVAGRAVEIPEAIVLAAAVLLAMTTGVPPSPEPLPTDPLPPVTDPEPVSPVPSPVPSPTPSSARRLSMPWYFRRNPIITMSVPERFCVEIDAMETAYRDLTSRDHSIKALTDYARFVRDGLSHEVKDAVHQLRIQSEHAGFSPMEEINYVLAFAQRFAYASDREDKGVAEYPKFPLETMWDDRGDCEDHAIVAAACLHLLGYDVRLVGLDYEGKPSGHMALAVATPNEIVGGSYLEAPDTGRRYYYCEVSTDGGTRHEGGVSFRLGEMPSSDRSAALTLIDISEHTSVA